MTAQQSTQSSETSEQFPPVQIKEEKKKVQTDQDTTCITDLTYCAFTLESFLKFFCFFFIFPHYLHHSIKEANKGLAYKKRLNRILILKEQ